MAWFGIGKDKKDRASQDAELAFEMWEQGWDGWIATEPRPLSQTEQEQSSGACATAAAGKAQMLR